VLHEVQFDVDLILGLRFGVPYVEFEIFIVALP
jgi:hypothetical protein